MVRFQLFALFSFVSNLYGLHWGEGVLTWKVGRGVGREEGGSGHRVGGSNSASFLPIVVC